MLIIKILLLIIMPLCAICQAPFKTNLIVIPTRDTTFLYYKVTSILKANGYKLEKPITSKEWITTEPKVVLEGVTMNLNLMVDTNGYINIIGHTFIPNVGISTIENLGMRGSPSQICWKEMDRTARQLGKRVYYRTTELPVY